MKYLTSLALVLAIAQATPVERSNHPQGIDVASWQPDINWPAVARSGIKFVYIKATEGTNYKSPTFNSQYTGATRVGLIRGAYHFARPDLASGGAQARFFATHGGGWSADGITLPGALDIEANPYHNGRNECYDLSHSEIVSWIEDFSNTYHSITSRYPVIYTSLGWWETCTGNSPVFGNNNPLWIAHWGSSEPGPLPAGWSYTSFWQYADTAGSNPGDADLWNGDLAGLKRMALGH